MKLKLSLNQLQVKLATLSFLLLFPGFFFYHFALGKGFIPPFLGGYFGIVAAFLFVPLALLNIKLFVKNIGLPVMIFFSIMFLILSVALIQYSLGNPTNYTKEMFVWSMGGLLFNLVSFIVASRLSIEQIAKAGYWLIALMFAIVVFNIGDHGIFYIKAEAGYLSDSVATYQGFARSIVVILLITSAYYFHKGVKLYPLVILGIIALFLNGARTEFALFVCSLAFVYFFYAITSFKKLVGFLFVMVMALFSVVNVIDLLPDSRMMQLFELASSTSGQSRLEMFWLGLELISNNPFLGSYGSYTANGGIGSYPHNLLSAWVNLGLFGFVLYILLFLMLWKVALKGFLQKKSDEYFKVFLIFLVFVTASLLVSKDYSYMLMGLLVGFYIQYRNKDKGILC
ncbi:MAG: O-antigen ligase family protein [Methyloprofundus sp.]|nr:O-antigen ligase family protein [Methyloprofundus sp.]